MKSLIECFKIVMTGNREASRKAAREVRRLVYSSGNGRDKYQDIKNIINSAPNEYAKISEEWRQENFVMAVSVMYFLHDKENQPDFIFSWLFELIQHNNGNIRHAVVRMFENELGPLSYHIRFPNEESNQIRELLPEKSDQILFGLFINLTQLLNDLWKPIYKKYKYIHSLPTGPYKSVQMVLGYLEEYCGREYMEKLEKSVTIKTNAR